MDEDQFEQGPTGAILRDLPSPYEAHSCGLLHLPRFLAKIRKHLAGELPKSYQRNFTKGFDGFLCLHLGVDPQEIIRAVRDSSNEEEVERRLAEMIPSERSSSGRSTLTKPRRCDSRRPMATSSEARASMAPQRGLPPLSTAPSMSFMIVRPMPCMCRGKRKGTNAGCGVPPGPLGTDFHSSNCKGPSSNRMRPSVPRTSNSRPETAPQSVDRR